MSLRHIFVGLLMAVMAAALCPNVDLPEVVGDTWPADKEITYIVTQISFSSQVSGPVDFRQHSGQFKDAILAAAPTLGTNNIVCSNLLITDVFYSLSGVSAVQVTISRASVVPSDSLIINQINTMLAGSPSPLKTQLGSSFSDINAVAFLAPSILYNPAKRVNCAYSAWTSCQTCQSVENQMSTRAITATAAFGGTACGATQRIITCAIRCPSASSGLSDGGIAGIVIGVIVFVAIVAVIIYKMVSRDKREPLNKGVEMASTDKAAKTDDPAPAPTSPEPEQPVSPMSPESISIDVHGHSLQMPTEDVKSDSENVVRVFL